jgi:hypothetical protein
VPREDPPPALGEAISVIHDPDGAAHRRYGAGSECLFLVRPDGYIGYRSQDGEKVYEAILAGRAAHGIPVLGAL